MGASFAAALRLLEERSETRWELGLDRIRRLLAALGDPHKAVPAVHVAGTNGKGTVCALTERILREAGYRTGLTISPHLESPVERIQIDGVPVSEAEFGRLLADVRAAEDEPATYFELLIAAAFLHFKRAGVQFAVVETGLGGRLDATNVLEAPLLTVIASIDFDHMQHLGDSLPAIAAEKAGILKPGSPCLTGALPEPAAAVVRSRAEEVGAPLTVRATPGVKVRRALWTKGIQELDGPGNQRWELRMLGEGAARNADLALAAASLLRRKGYAIPDEAIGRAFAGISWPCRFELFDLEGRTVVLDGAHNAAAMANFLRTWEESRFGLQPSAFIIGVLKDKDFAPMLKALAKAAGKAIAVRPDSPRALEAEETARLLRAAGCETDVAGSPEQALELFRRSEARVGAVCGSFYLAGRFRRLLQGAAA